jgi:dynein assembly factor 1
MVDMTKDALKQICKDLKLYNTPAINDKLYCHYKGFRKIENLDEYTNLRVIWLEGNGFNKIEGLEHCTNLRTLYLQENLISSIENLEALQDLDTLQLSQNSISRIENLSFAKKLQTVQLKNNYLKTAEDIAHVLECPSISCLDIQHNKIDDPTIVDVLEKMPNLRVLYLQGNDVVKKIKWYRKSMITRCKSLKYLDDRPVFPDERLRAVAWCKGWAEHGTVDAARESERLELERQRAEKKQKEIDNFKAFDNMVRKAREKGAAAKKEKESLPQEYINIFSGEIIMPKEEVNMFTGEPIIPARESDVVRKARQARWGHVVGEEMPEHTDADMTPAEREERQRVREVCITIGDGTFNDQQAESQRTYRQTMSAKETSSSQGDLFNQSFVNTICENNPVEVTATKNNVSPNKKEPVFFNQTNDDVINNIQACRSKNNNSPQQDKEFTNMEELD